MESIQKNAKPRRPAPEAIDRSENPDRERRRKQDSPALIGLKMTGLAILGIPCFGTVFAAALMFFVDSPKAPPPTSTLAYLALGGAAAGALCTWAFLRLNNQWKRIFSARFDDEPEAILAQWWVPFEVWSKFTEDERNRSRRDLREIAIVFGAVLGILALIIGWCAGGFLPGLGAGFGIGLVSSSFLYTFEWLVAAGQYHWRSRQSEVEIRVRPDGIRINRKLIAWNQFGSRLKSVRADRKAGGERYDVFEIVVSVPTNRNRVDQEHRVAFPTRKRRSIARMIEQLSPAVTSD